MQRDCVSLFYISILSLDSVILVFQAERGLCRLCFTWGGWFHPLFFFLLSFFSPSIIMWMSLWGPPFFSLLLLLLFPSGKKKKPPAHMKYPVDNNVSKLFFIFFIKKKYFSDIFLSHSISSCVCVYTAVCNLSRMLSVRLTNNKEQHTGLLFPSFIDFPSYSHQRRESTVENLTSRPSRAY